MGTEFDTLTKVKNTASTASSKFTSDFGQINDELNAEAAANYHKSNDWTEQDAKDYEIELDRQMHIAGLFAYAFVGLMIIFVSLFILTEIGVL